MASTSSNNNLPAEDANLFVIDITPAPNGIIDLQLLEEQFSFLTEHESCSICSGFYGPCFGQPVCATCHAFLYPEDLAQAGDIDTTLWDSYKKDDGDSGNDEPSDPYLFAPSERRVSDGRDGANMFRVQQEVTDRSCPDTPEEESPPRAIDRLTERLQMLSTPREPDPETDFMEKLPPEVLLSVFQYLDDLSLCACSNVCQFWNRLLEFHSNDNKRWKKYTLLRWPLFKPMQEVNSWWKCYQKLVSSAPCFLCIQQMFLQPLPSGEENSWRRHRLHSEIKSIKFDPPEGIQAVPLDKACCHWQASIVGPQGSPYAGGIFYLHIQVPYSYPMSPPVVRFVTKIFHPNVSRHGDIGIDLISHNWSLAMTIAKVLISVQSLLTDPFCEVCMEPEVGNLYLEKRESFDLMARKWTWKYAMNEGLPPVEPLEI